MEKLTRYQRYYRRHKEERKKKSSDYANRTRYYSTPNGKAAHKKYRIKNKEKLNQYAKDRARRFRDAVIEILGGKCVKCGFDDKRALQIDHINGDGNIERLEGKGFGSGYAKRVLESVIKGENKYQLLCANHNWIKRCENNEVKRNK